MVEYSESLDRVFRSLADGTRRDMLQRLSRGNLTVGELARPYAMSLAAIAKHVNVLEKAGLVTKNRQGKEKSVGIVPETMKAAEAHLSEYEKLWAARFDALENLLAKDEKGNKSWPTSKSRSRRRRSGRWQRP